MIFDIAVFGLWVFVAAGALGWLAVAISGWRIRRMSKRELSKLWGKSHRWAVPVVELDGDQK